jgi:hypothetical protein
LICWARTALARSSKAAVNTALSDTLRGLQCLALIFPLYVVRVPSSVPGLAGGKTLAP